MTKLLLLGAGKIGGAITALLADTGDYAVTVADSDEAMLELIPDNEAARESADLSDAKSILALAQEKDVIVSALPFYLNVSVAETARAVGAHYFDLTEDVETTVAVRSIADNAATAFVPQCGLAPGFVSIVANDVAGRFESLRDVHMRVGALPQYPVNALKYNLTWSTDGLINEYCNPCDAVHDGARVQVMALEGLEHFSLDGVRYEAFNTSGGLGTLGDTLEGKVDSLNYKTVRYPGHRDMVKMLVRDLRLSERRTLFRDLLDTAIPMTKQDVVLIFVTVAGEQEGRLTQETYAKKIYNSEIHGREWSAIQVTTASGICAMVDLLIAGKLPQKGFVRQEQCHLEDFLGNRFGRHYA
ncbi:MAG: saccharopine dehydrogenase NADP-binding domain-containing protein [Alphaproteobacteria bacterium]|nr:saccharopine dehydrogenase NADP-binding domain-containing protein [Alphaproteobacteria bacterium]